MLNPFNWPLYVVTRTVHAAKIVSVRQIGPGPLDLEVHVLDPVTNKIERFLPTFTWQYAHAKVGGYALVAPLSNRRIFISEKTFLERYAPTDEIFEKVWKRRLPKRKKKRPAMWVGEMKARLAVSNGPALRKDGTPWRKYGKIRLLGMRK